MGAAPTTRIIRPMHGLHLTADLRDCPVNRAVMTEPEALRRACVGAVHAAGLQPVGELFHRFVPAPGADEAAPVGLTGVVLLAESHLAVHTWPEIAAVTLDVYVCNLGADNSERAHALLESLVDAFAPGSIERHALERGRGRAERWAAPEPARIPSGDRSMYPSTEGLP
ncbi:MAG: S-adenosylmethionine decarboxylase [Burkholderiales bacterium]